MSKLLHFSFGNALSAALTLIGALRAASLEDPTPRDPVVYLSGARSRPWWS